MTHQIHWELVNFTFNFLITSLCHHSHGTAGRKTADRKMAVRMISADRIRHKSDVHRTADGRLAERKTADGRLAERKTADDRLAERKTAGHRLAERKTAGHSFSAADRSFSAADRNLSTVNHTRPDGSPFHCSNLHRRQRVLAWVPDRNRDEFQSFRIERELKHRSLYHRCLCTHQHPCRYRRRSLLLDSRGIIPV